MNKIEELYTQGAKECLEPTQIYIYIIFIFLIIIYLNCFLGFGQCWEVTRSDFWNPGLKLDLVLELELNPGPGSGIGTEIVFNKGNWEFFGGGSYLSVSDEVTQNWIWFPEPELLLFFQEPDQNQTITMVRCYFTNPFLFLEVCLSFKLKSNYLEPCMNMVQVWPPKQEYTWQPSGEPASI